MSIPRLPGYLGQLQDSVTNSSSQPPMTMPATVAGGHGVVPAAPINTAKELPEPRRLSPRQAEQLMQAELLSAVRSLVESSTEIAGRLGRRGATNGVLEVWGGQFDGSGIIKRTYEVAVGSLVIVNLDAATTISCQSGVPAGDSGIQQGGLGVQYILPLTRLVMPVGDRSFTLAGPAGSRIGLQVFTGLQPFGAGVL